MLLTVTTTHRPATDLGYLLGKHPGRAQSFTLSFGKAHVFYPEAEDARCTVALLLDVDPIELVRYARRAGSQGLLAHYVNDRPYVASSLLSVAISKVFGQAMGGRSRERPEVAEAELPLEARIPRLPCRGGEPMLRALFEPLGYEVLAEGAPLDESFPEWGPSPYFSVVLRRTCRLAELLTQLYVLVPVLDDSKHYYVGEDEIEKLVDKGAGWLAAHPSRDAIVARYLRRNRRLTSEALARLTADEEPDPEAAEEGRDAREAALERGPRLDTVRLDAVVETLVAEDVASVADVGCGEGKLLARLLRDRRFERILGMDVSSRALAVAEERLHVDRMPTRQRARLTLVQGSVTYRDARLEGFDAICAVEVLEHLEPSRLDDFARIVFEQARPRVVVLTTPNAEYNVLFETLARESFRHPDHRFEWTRAEFEGWARPIAERFGYGVRFAPIGPVSGEVGAPTQMGVFSR